MTDLMERVDCGCAACGRDTGASGPAPEPAAARTRLCPACTRGLVAGLARLPRLYDECGLLLGGSARRPRERTSGGGSSPGLPFDTAAADARSMILGVLRSWAGLVVQERSVAAPRDSVAAVAGFLIQHSGWLAAHEAAGELAAEITRAARRALRVVNPSPQAVHVGTCPTADCQGTLTTTVRGDQSEPRVEISCAAIPTHRWSAHEWMALSRDAPADRAERPASLPAAPKVQWLSAKDISLLWAMPRGSVYRHASEHQWRRRTGSDGRTLYHAQDVLHSLGARTGARS